MLSLLICIEELDKGPFTWDIYDMGRTILGSLGTHIIPDDDAEAERCYLSQEPFTDDVKDLSKTDPLACHLIELCLSCKYVVTWYKSLFMLIQI